MPALLQSGEDEDAGDDADERSEWQQRFETELQVLLAPFGKSNAEIKAMNVDEVVAYQKRLEKESRLGAPSVGEFYKEFCDSIWADSILDPATRTTKKQRLGWMIGTLRGWSAAPS